MAIAVLLVVAAVVAVTVWRARGEPTAPPTAGPGPTTGPTANAAEAAATAKVLAAYNGFREAQITAEATADYNYAALKNYIASPLLNEVGQDLYLKNRQGIVVEGRPTWSPKVTAINITTRPHTATIQDCFDHSNWNAIFKATGKSAAAPGQATRYVVTAGAKLYDDGRWLIFEAKADRSRTC